jgi:hypothetical protein
MAAKLGTGQRQVNRNCTFVTQRSVSEG